MPAAASVTVRCDCGSTFDLSARSAFRHRQHGTTPRCPDCRRAKHEPTERDREFWIDRLGLEGARELAGTIWPLEDC